MTNADVKILTAENQSDVAEPIAESVFTLLGSTDNIIRLYRNMES